MRSPILASAILFAPSAAAPSPALRKADAIVEPSTAAPASFAAAAASGAPDDR